MLNEVKDLAARGHSKTEVARLLNIGRLRVHRLAKKHDITFRRGSPSDGAEIYDYRAEVRGLPAEEAVDYLLDVIEQMLPRKTDLNEVYEILPSVSRQEARILQVMLKNRGMVMTSETLWNAATFERIRPASKLVPVVILSLRKKIKAAGLELKIVTVWGVGYRLEQGRTD